MSEIIDRRGVLETYRKWCAGNCPYSEAQRRKMCKACDTGSAIEVLENAPTLSESAVVKIIFDNAKTDILSEIDKLQTYKRSGGPMIEKDKVKRIVERIL